MINCTDARKSVLVMCCARWCLGGGAAATATAAAEAAADAAAAAADAGLSLSLSLSSLMDIKLNNFKLMHVLSIKLKVN